MEVPGSGIAPRWTELNIPRPAGLAYDEAWCTAIRGLRAAKVEVILVSRMGRLN